jgi:DNA-directed RNA polymerase subunit K/omega
MSTQLKTEDENYFARRARQVREMAEKAADPGIRSIHAELARLYAQRATQGQHG